MVLTVPEILNIPPKLLPMITEIDNKRYYLIDGGRSSGKTQSIARLILYLAEHRCIRVVCGRETQNSIEESVYTVFADLIRVNNLDFSVTATKIDHNVSGSAIRFRGFREQGATNIKGLEGVDILWVDESQAIKKDTLDIIIPTIRKENSKIIWSMNRMTENDPVFAHFVNHKDCLHIHIDYHENPYCPKAMISEAEECMKRSESDYNYIWLGRPLPKGDDYLLSPKVIYDSAKLEFLHTGIEKRILAVDVARYGEDETVFCIVESADMIRWQQIHQETWKNKSLMEVCGKVLDLQMTWNCDNIVIDDTGMGGGVTDRLREQVAQGTVLPFLSAGKSRNGLYPNARSEGYFDMQEMLTKQYLKIMPDPTLAEQLASIRFEYRSERGLKAIVSKDKMKHEGIKSPDRADALMMAIYYRQQAILKRSGREFAKSTYDVLA